MTKPGQGYTERRLAAILAADVAGYSRLMGADEAGTAQALREHLAAITGSANAIPHWRQLR
jgi:class 3 adenylate cyclase